MLSRLFLSMLIAASALCVLPFESQARSGRAVTVEIALDDITMVSRYFPANGSAPAPALLLLHGWNWPDIDPSAGLVEVAAEFQRAGFSVLVPSMRGWPPSGGIDDCAGRQVGDALKVLAWLGQQPGVDAGRLYLSGFSQGGQVALLAASQGAPVQAVAAFAPVVDPGSWGEATNIGGIRDYVMQECGGPAGWRSRSVLKRSAELMQPLLLVHGDADRRVPTQQSIGLFNKLAALERPVQLRLIAGAGHDQDAVLQPQLAIEFFRSNPGEGRVQK